MDDLKLYGKSENQVDVRQDNSLGNGLLTLIHLLFMDDLKLYGKSENQVDVHLHVLDSTVCPSSQWRPQNVIGNRKMCSPGHEEEETCQVRGFCHPGWKTAWFEQSTALYPGLFVLSEWPEEAWNQARIFPTSLTGDVTSEIAENNWERGWAV